MGPGALRPDAWQDGSGRWFESRFVAVRVPAGHRDYWRAGPREELWLSARRARGAAGPAQCRLTELPPETALEELLRLAGAAGLWNEAAWS